MIGIGSKVRNLGGRGLGYVGVVAAYVPPMTSGRGVAKMKRLPGANRLRNTYRVRGSWLVIARDKSVIGKRGSWDRVYWPTKIEEVRDGD